MTFRQVIDVLWQRRLLVVATLGLVLLSAYAYLMQQVPTYAAHATVRLSPAATQVYDGSTGGYPGVDLDTDDASITSPAVLDPAARSLPGTSPSTLAGAVSTAVTEGRRTNSIAITAVGQAPEAARDRANAVSTAYTAYLEAEVATGLKLLQKEQDQAAEQVAALQTQVGADGRNKVAATNLASAIANLASINGNINAVASAGSPATVLREATLGVSDSTPPATVLAVALAAGLLAGFGVALVREQFDDRLRDEHEIETITGAPSLGALALDRKRKPTDTSIPALSRRPTAFTEGIRTVRTSIQVLAPTRHAAVVVTSPEPGDGKTFISVNLAASWARTGKSVILVGADLRRSRISVYFDVAGEGPGLSELIQRAERGGLHLTAADVRGLLRATEIKGLSVVPSGGVPSDPSDLLATKSAGVILDLLREEADVVIVDSPPALAVADAAILSEHTDGVVVLASLGRTPRAMLVDTVKVLRANGAQILGVVPNRSRRKVPKSYRSYYLGDRVVTSSSTHVSADDAVDPAGSEVRGEPGVPAAGTASARHGTSQEPAVPVIELTTDPVSGTPNDAWDVDGTWDPNDAWLPSPSSTRTFPTDS